MTLEEIKEREQQVKRELREKLATVLRSWAKAAEESDQWDDIQDMSGGTGGSMKVFRAKLTEDVTIKLVAYSRELSFHVLIKKSKEEPCPPNPIG